jgi:hypothetical protein
MRFIRISQIAIGLGLLAAMLFARDDRTREVALLVIGMAGLLSFGGIWPTRRCVSAVGWRANCWNVSRLAFLLACFCSSAITFDAYRELAHTLLQSTNFVVLVSVAWLLILVELPFAPEYDPDAEHRRKGQVESGQGP